MKKYLDMAVAYISKHALAMILALLVTVTAAGVYTISTQGVKEVNVVQELEELVVEKDPKENYFCDFGHVSFKFEREDAQAVSGPDGKPVGYFLRLVFDPPAIKEINPDPG